MTNNETFSYTFSIVEVKAFILFIRKNEENISPELEPFVVLAEKFLYDNMSIEEAEIFFS